MIIYDVYCIKYDINIMLNFMLNYMRKIMRKIYKTKSLCYDSSLLHQMWAVMVDGWTAGV
jgi:hypothetical protein